MVPSRCGATTRSVTLRSPTCGSQARIGGKAGWYFVFLAPLAVRVFAHANFVANASVDTARHYVEQRRVSAAKAKKSIKN